jgi:sterol desaturase/sphingolipid hydroxylase (fatty acid hydroxylase superfamily)
MSGAERLPAWLSGLLVGGAFLGLLLLEWRRPLRRSVEPKLRRTARNFAVAAVSAAALRVAEMPVVNPLSAWVEESRWGLLKLASLPLGLEVLLAVLLLDYTLYLWHILLHKVPLLWRCHQAHHVDLDMDASTALRFHFAELVASIPWRAGQVALIGVSPLALSVWQTATLLEVLFHHSNLELPVGVERWLNKLIVTPRMHGIHHSVVPEEQNANWSSGLTLWDWLHGTLRLNVPQAEITVGVPAYQHPKDVTLPKVLAMPFTPQRPAWELPEGGAPTRQPLPAPPHHLVA